MPQRPPSPIHIAPKGLAASGLARPLRDSRPERGEVLQHLGIDRGALGGGQVNAEVLGHGGGAIVALSGVVDPDAISFRRGPWVPVGLLVAIMGVPLWLYS